MAQAAFAITAATTIYTALAGVLQIRPWATTGSGPWKEVFGLLVAALLLWVPATFSPSRAPATAIDSPIEPEQQPTTSPADEPIWRLLQALPGGDRPLWIQVEQRIREAITAGRLPDSAPLPPERAIATHFSVSVGTVRKATAHGRDKGYLTTGSNGRHTIHIGPTITDQVSMPGPPS
ncbi:winged helix-turn-helix domain-containing protein [Asanoa iriomotensis]|uniref:HTH gntR-type domain-containing protein n=1 Tax=Asanoa iriomotensis TaxID=234613 RepID=A0ABQ4C5I0_9ACTN|nr:winged helix-turn-helix domain-containing protein [Asanoa iriomotensis]GIF58004.1 hypothetical protein Air01nite_40990 [Asanoa iriomotensis]